MDEIRSNKPRGGDALPGLRKSFSSRAERAPKSRLDRLVSERTAHRRAIAKDRVVRLLDATRHEPFDLAVIGSLAAGGFALHSDVDLLVRGPADANGRVGAEQAVAEAMRGSGIAYDLVFASDLTPARRAEFEHDLVEPSRLREAWAEAGADLSRTP